MKKNYLLFQLTMVLVALLSSVEIANAQTINLANYVRVGRYDLPEPTRTAHPVNNLLCQEASGVTYNWD